MKHLGTLCIETDRLFLRGFINDDAEAMYRNWANDGDVTTYLTWMPHGNVELTEKILSLWIDDYKLPATYIWGIVLKDIDEVIGSISVVNRDDEAGRCEVGYCIGKSFWGKGIMTEALKGVLDFLINKVGYNRVHAYHHSANKASGRVMAKAGMKYEGCLRDYVKNSSGIYTDCDMYSIIKKDFEK